MFLQGRHLQSERTASGHRRTWKASACRVSTSPDNLGKTRVVAWPMHSMAAAVRVSLRASRSCDRFAVGRSYSFAVSRAISPCVGGTSGGIAERVAFAAPFNSGTCAANSVEGGATPRGLRGSVLLANGQDRPLANHQARNRCSNQYDGRNIERVSLT